MTFSLPGQRGPRATLAIFCKVVDNFGDIGICWRLARQLHHEHGLDVTLWVDDLASFGRIWPQADPACARQRQDGVEVRHWSAAPGPFGPADVADIVIEFFGCDIPEAYLEAMAQCTPRPVWLNLEGLTAEEWVEGCHTLPSTHPRLGLVKHFFFPGFTARTGGLMHEAGLDAQRDAFQADPAARAAFLAGLGVAHAEMAGLTVSLFCYPHAPLGALLGAWRDQAAPVTLLVPQGVAGGAVEQFLGRPAEVGASMTRGALTLRVIPFVPQPDYDKLLWSCDLNLVRGEDSFVRAQWAGRPFVWHIYPQDEALHHKKLRAFLQRYRPAQAGAADSLDRFSLRWNGADAGSAGADASMASLWTALQADLNHLAAHAAHWQRACDENGEMTANMLAFAASLRR